MKLKLLALLKNVKKRVFKILGLFKGPDNMEWPS
jgi:hypothetical protein